MKISVIVPCYNETKRLDMDVFAAFSKTHSEYSFVFVDDCSTDNTFEFLNKNKFDGMKILKLEKNVGKAEAVRAGFLYVLDNFDDIFYIAFIDADLAMPLSEIPNFFRYLIFFEGKKVDAIFGSRIKRLGGDITRSENRHRLSRIFVTMTCFLIKDIKTYDSQCGAKIFTREASTKAFNEPFISNWVFDIEVQLRLREMTVIEYPVLKWTEISDSKVNLIKSVFSVVIEIFKIKAKYNV